MVIKMLTLDIFLEDSKDKKIEPRKTIKHNTYTYSTKRELTWSDLPEEINSELKAKNYIDKIKQNKELYSHFEPIIELIEHGSVNTYKYKGKKKILIAEGFKPYTRLHLLYEFFKGTKRFGADKE